MSKKTKRRDGSELPTGFLNLSITMYRFACHTAHLAGKAEPFQPAIALPMSSVLHATAALEAFVNEEIERACLELPDLRERLINVQSWHIVPKWEKVPELLLGRAFKKDTEPFLAFKALVRLRKELVHYKPVTRAMNVLPDVKNELSRYKFIRGGSDGAPLDWSAKLLTPECARWACETARAMVLGWYDLDNPHSPLRAFADYRWSLDYLDGKEPLPYVVREPSGDNVKIFPLRIPVSPEALAILEATSEATRKESARRAAERRARVRASQPKGGERDE